MTSRDASFHGSIPGLYDDYLVPLIFEPYALDLARRAAALAPRRVLETAAGTGVVPRAVAPVLGADARYMVTDLNPAMLERARSRQPGDPRLDWQAADATALDLPDGGFDLVLCQFGAMFFPDRVRGYAEARRVLDAEGRFILSIWDGIEANDFARLVTDVAAGLFPDDPPRFLARTPHGHGDPAIIERELRSAGFATVEIEMLEATSRAQSPRHPAIAYVQGTPLRGEIEARDASRLG
ncbi:MAG: class I SAM-dependent methyltransferase, partial [Geminicoccaceae bacterium]